jgi:thiol-disulfide isomerase/thioredoxin
MQLNTRFKRTWFGGALALVGSILAMVWFLYHSEIEARFYRASPLTPVPAQVGGSPAVMNIAHPRPAPLFELPQADGKPFKLESLKGSAVMIHFWASWCPPCLGEIPHWLEFAAKWRDKPVRFVAVSLDQGWPEALKILPLSQLPSNAISVLDREQELPDQFGTYQYPETYLLDADLKIVSKWIGPQEWGGPKIRAALEAVLP